MNKNYKILYLDKEDKEKLQKLAQAKQLSLSTLVEIIVYNLQRVMNKDLTNYIYKGSKQIYTKPRTNRCYIKAECSMNVIYTNIIYMYLHQEHLKKYLDPTEIKKSLRKIQSECDKTYDPRFDYNSKIRTEYYLIKKIVKEQTK